MRQRGSFLALTEANFGIFASVFQTKRVSEKVVKFQLPTAADAPERLATSSAPHRLLDSSSAAVEFASSPGPANTKYPRV